ncbi:competence protein ComK [Bacillus pinisoli]|uniref:competence protein ComK n=1 Tax=Bacillus pinisoli TaxID=2901866 RepID=UPI001FF2309F|nr:competence protein ComK [Bacillus pinisoli]
MKKQILTEYEISPYTMAILPEVTDKGVHSIVKEMDREYMVTMKPIDIIDRSCHFFGSSLKGRREATKFIMGITHKAPIVIDPTNYIYFFPTSSPNRQQCSWISHSFVQSIQTTKYDETLLTFSNKEEIVLPISKGSIENQLYRTAQLRTTLSSRISPDFRKSSFMISPHFHHSEVR